jgi:hypothetical protein
VSRDEEGSWDEAGAAAQTNTAPIAHRAKNMPARYTLTRTYAKMKLTLLAALPRFVRPRTP